MTEKLEEWHCRRGDAGKENSDSNWNDFGNFWKRDEFNQAIIFWSVKPCSVYHGFEGICWLSLSRVDICKKIMCFLRNMKDSEKHVLVHFSISFITKHFTNYSRKTKRKPNFTTRTVGRGLFWLIYYVHATRNTSEVEL